ncbi:MAG: HPr family phosphocarrier protein [Lachnospiraceae bacterium]|nr:HPr family phosphocarrier protein [Lachnospiraceae bacterium]
MIEKAVTVQMSGKQDREPVAALLVQAASRYRSAIYLKNGRYNVNAKSIMGMMMLSIRNGDKIQVTAEGADESEAVQRMEQCLCCSG